VRCSGGSGGVRRGLHSGQARLRWAGVHAVSCTLHWSVKYWTVVSLHQQVSGRGATAIELLTRRCPHDGSSPRVYRYSTSTCSSYVRIVLLFYFFEAALIRTASSAAPGWLTLLYREVSYQNILQLLTSCCSSLLKAAAVIVTTSDRLQKILSVFCLSFFVLVCLFTNSYYYLLLIITLLLILMSYVTCRLSWLSTTGAAYHIVFESDDDIEDRKAAMRHKWHGLLLRITDS